MSVLPPRRRVASLAVPFAIPLAIPLAVSFTLSAGLLGLAGAAQAETARHRTGQVLVAAPPLVWTAAEAAPCSRTRRKFWQAGEGWIVKTVSVCR